MPSSDLIRFAEAKKAIDAGDVDRGLALTRAALADAAFAGPGRTYTHLLLVVTLAKLGRHAEAEAAVRAALAEPLGAEDRAELRFRLAEILAVGGREADALAEYRALLADAGADAPAVRREVWLAVAALERRRGDDEAVRRAHRQLVHDSVRLFLLDPSSFMVDREEADGLLERFAERYPGDEAAQLLPLVMTVIANLAEGEPAESQTETIGRIAKILAGLFPDDLASVFPTRDELEAMTIQAQASLDESRALLERALALMAAKR